MEPVVIWKTDGALAELILNSPQTHNSLTIPFLEEMGSALAALSENPEIRVILFWARGRSFSRGVSEEIFTGDRETLAQFTALLNQTLVRMFSLPVPLVCAVHDLVANAAFGFVLASDLVLIAPQAGFAPFAGMPLPCPFGGWTALLPQVIGRRRAAEILLRGKTLNARKALQWGLVNTLTPGDHLHKKARKTAVEISRRNGAESKIVKRLLGMELSTLSARLEAERQEILACIG